MTTTFSPVPGATSRGSSTCSPAKGHKPEFTGGLEARLLTFWAARRMRSLSPESLFFAYDHGDSLDDLRRAAYILGESGFAMNQHRERCYVLVGYKGDTMEEAERRIKDVWDLGFLPMAMLYRGKDGYRDPRWMKFQSIWVNPARVRAVVKELSN